MSEKQSPWFRQWFNEDYLKLYSHRTSDEAEKQVNFLIDFLKLTGKKRVLDLGCGMGRHSLAFAEKGHEVLGIDLSEYLIEKAKETLDYNPSLLLFFQVGNIYQQKKLGFFDLVINMFTSFGYFSLDCKNASLFHIVRQYLPSGGKFFLDYLHPYQVRRDLIPYERRCIDRENVEIERKIDGDRIIKSISFPGRTYSEKVKLYHREKITEMLSSHRFEVIHVWNDYQGNPWREHGDRQLFFCQAI